MLERLSDARAQLHDIVLAGAKAAVAAGELPDAPIGEFTVEIPADTGHGDFAANLALVSAKTFKKSPRDVAAAIVAHLQLEGSDFERCEVAGPGFLNFFLGSGFYAGIVGDVLEHGDAYGRTEHGRGKKINVEFVSANPTGPMHIGNARGGALGDCLAAVLEAAGYDVTREFYINDAGNQIEKFGVSLEARYMQLFDPDFPMPADGYQGDDITAHAKKYAEMHGDSLVALDSQQRKQALVDYALPLNISGLERDLKRYRIIYDVWFRESTLHESGAVTAAIDTLRKNGRTYEKDGALWYRAPEPEDGSERKDEVLVRNNGIPTYFAADIAYHYNKLKIRGFDISINIWGADHHAHVARLRGAIDALGLDGQRMEVILMQLVRLVRDGEQVRMSKRTGKAIALVDLLDELPVDAARFFFNLHEPNSQMEFDLDLAVKQSSENPVYYVQYAHARICSILRSLQQAGIEQKSPSECDLRLLSTAEERALIRRLALLPGEIVAAAAERNPTRVTRYAIDLAGDFHRFYNACRVMDSEESLRYPRILLCDAAAQALRNCLSLLKIDAPESM